MSDIPLAPIDRIFRQEGAERVSAEATRKMQEFLEEKLAEYAHATVILTKKAGRKTVIADDVNTVISIL